MDGDAERAFARRDAYLAYSRLLDFPTAELAAAARDGSVGRTMAELHRRAGAPAPPSMGTLLDDARLEQVYIATFDVGIPEPPVPLYETAYLSPDRDRRLEVLEEVVRFRDFFDLKPAAAAKREMPDHVTVELEMMAALAHMEGLALELGTGAEAFRLAQGDFLGRHLRPMLGAMKRRPIPEAFYRDLLDGLEALAA